MALVAQLACALLRLLFAATHAHRHLQLAWPRDARRRARARSGRSSKRFPSRAGTDGPSTRASESRRQHPAAHRAARARDLARLRPCSRARASAGACAHRAAPAARAREPRQLSTRTRCCSTIASTRWAQSLSSRLNRRVDAGHRPLTALRERIARHIEQRVADRDAAALISALAVGATGSMSREQWRVFNATGTTHLVAISGLHVTLFAVVMFAVARRAVVGAAVAMDGIDPRQFAAVIGLAPRRLCGARGLSVPTQRTLIMLARVAARAVAGAVSTPFQPFALALLAVLLLDPFAPLAAGILAVFRAMGAIICVTQTRLVRRAMREAAGGAGCRDRRSCSAHARLLRIDLRSSARW